MHTYKALFKLLSSNWWEKLDLDEQRAYLKAHPRSKLKINALVSTQKQPTKISKPKIIPVIETKSKPKLEFEGRSHVPVGFNRNKLFHGTDQPLETNDLFPKKNFIFLSDEGYASSKYARNVYCCYVKSDIKKVDFTENKEQPILTSLFNHFKKDYPNLKQIIKTGKLWKNKVCEKKVINYIFSKGYEGIELIDELEEKGGESRSFIIANPQHNVYVDKKAEDRELKNEFDDDY